MPPTYSTHPPTFPPKTTGRKRHHKRRARKGLSPQQGKVLGISLTVVSALLIVSLVAFYVMRSKKWAEKNSGKVSPSPPPPPPPRAPPPLFFFHVPHSTSFELP